MRKFWNVIGWLLEGKYAIFLGIACFLFFLYDYLFVGSSQQMDLYLLGWAEGLILIFFGILVGSKKFFIEGEEETMRKFWNVIGWLLKGNYAIFLGIACFLFFLYDYLFVGSSQQMELYLLGWAEGLILIFFGILWGSKKFFIPKSKKH